MLYKVDLWLLLLLLGRASVPLAKRRSLSVQSCISSSTALLTLGYIPHCIAAVFSSNSLVCQEENCFSVCLIKSGRKKSLLCITRFTNKAFLLTLTKPLPPYVLFQQCFSNVRTFPTPAPFPLPHLTFNL